MGFFILSSVGGGIAAEPQTAAKLTEYASHEGPTYSVKMTGYNAVVEQTNADPFTTASGAYSNPNIVAARSVDLADTLPYGTVIAIEPASPSKSCGISVVDEQIGLRVVADSMHPRKRDQIDIMFDQNRTVQLGDRSLNPAVVMGICDDVKIRVVGRIAVSEMPETQKELRTALAEQKALALGK